MWKVALFAFSVALPVVAQQRGMYGGASSGRMVGGVSDPGFAGSLGATVSGLPQTGGRAPVHGGIYGGNRGQGYYGGSRRTNTVVIPYGAPMVYSGFGYSAYPGSYDAPPPPQYVQPVEPAPSVIINQYFTPDSPHPMMREYDNLPEPIRPQPRPRREPSEPPPPAALNEQAPQADKPTVTLLAFKDSSVAAVIAYWAQSDELHYITKGFKKNVVSLSTLDKATTEQLNKERNVEFTLE